MTGRGSAELRALEPMEREPAWRPPLPAPGRVLVSRLRREDVILSLPLVDALRRDSRGAHRLPGRVRAGAGRRGPPAIERVLSFRPGRSGRSRAAAGPPRAADRALRLDDRPLRKSALGAALAWTGAPVRVGPARRGQRHLYTHLVPSVREPISAVRHHLLALAALDIHMEPTAPRIHLGADERARGAAILDEALPPGRRARRAPRRQPLAAKRWPPERFAALARALPGLGARAVVLGGPGEEAAVSEVAERSGAPRLRGLPLRDYWAVLASLDAFVTNDGSPLHAGAALGVPTVGILGPTVPEIWFRIARRTGMGSSAARSGAAPATGTSARGSAACTGSESATRWPRWLVRSSGRRARRAPRVRRFDPRS